MLIATEVIGKNTKRASFLEKILIMLITPTLKVAREIISSLQPSILAKILKLIVSAIPYTTLI